MDPDGTPETGVVFRLPRVSGDGPHHIFSVGQVAVVAPRERGWTRVARVPRLVLRGCPA